MGDEIVLGFKKGEILKVKVDEVVIIDETLPYEERAANAEEYLYYSSEFRLTIITCTDIHATHRRVIIVKEVD